MDFTTTSIRSTWTSAITNGDWPPIDHPDYSKFTDAQLEALKNWATDGQTFAESYSEIYELISVAGDAFGDVAGKLA